MRLVCLEYAFPKVGYFGILFCNLQTIPVMSTNFFDFLASLWIPTSSKNIIVIPFVVHEILGGGGKPLPPDAIKLSEKADAIKR